MVLKIFQVTFYKRLHSNILIIAPPPHSSPLHKHAMAPPGAIVCSIYIGIKPRNILSCENQVLSFKKIWILRLLDSAISVGLNSSHPVPPCVTSKGRLQILVRIPPRPSYECVKFPNISTFVFLLESVSCLFVTLWIQLYFQKLLCSSLLVCPSFSPPPPPNYM
jgi:hypothetical protein